MQPLSLALIFLAVCVLALSKRTNVESRGLFFFRLFFPSWHFFGNPENAPTLYYRIVLNDQPGDWVQWRKTSSLKWHQLFLNSGGNEALAKNNMVDHLSQELEKLEDSVPYQLILHWLRNEIAQPFQFKLVVDGDEALLSPIYGQA